MLTYTKKFSQYEKFRKRFSESKNYDYEFDENQTILIKTSKFKHCERYVRRNYTYSSEIYQLDCHKIVSITCY